MQTWGRLLFKGNLFVWLEILSRPSLCPRNDPCSHKHDPIAFPVLMLKRLMQIFPLQLKNPSAELLSLQIFHPPAAFSSLFFCSAASRRASSSCFSLACVKHLPDHPQLRMFTEWCASHCTCNARSTWAAACACSEDLHVSYFAVNFVL